MLPWIKLGTAQVPAMAGAQAGELRLMQRGSEYAIMIGQIGLMNSRLSGSEEALATLAFARLAGVKAPHILIGGLGMGFTLRAALAVSPPDGRAGRWRRCLLVALRMPVSIFMSVMSRR
jgi:spermidine synthase